MKYLGSKRRIAKHILPIMLKEAERNGLSVWVEPFVGGGNMIDKVPPHYKRIGYDLNPHTIAALIAIRDWVGQLPDRLSEKEHRALKGLPPEPINSWLRFVASFAGIFDSGYARMAGSDDATFIGMAKRNAQDQSPKLRGVKLHCRNYTSLTNLEGCLIYCDPPYAGTTSYKIGAFNHEAFWQWCRIMSKKNVVFISEYNAPADFKCVWQGELSTGFASQRIKETNRAIERLFVYCPEKWMADILLEVLRPKSFKDIFIKKLMS